MFLLAQRLLLPGDEGDHYKEVCLYLKEIWCKGGTNNSQTTRETKLANILLHKMSNPDMDATLTSFNWFGRLDETLALGAYRALKLLHELGPSDYQGYF